MENQESKIESKKMSWGWKAMFLGFVIIFGIFTVYNLLNFPLESVIEENLAQSQSIGIVSKDKEEKPQVDYFAPSFVSEDVFGNKFSLSDFQNKKPVLLVFWATWCGYCAKELPVLKSFTQKYQDEIQVVAVDSGEARATIRNYIQQKDINFLILLDEDRKIWNQYSVRGTPSHFLIDKKGEIVALWPGLISAEILQKMFIVISE